MLFGLPLLFEMYRRVLNKAAALWRHPGFRFWIAVAVSLPATWCVRPLLGGPPTNFDTWPEPARIACAAAVGGWHHAAFVVWLLVLARPLRWCDDTRVRLACRLVLASIVVPIGLGALTRFGAAANAMAEVPTPGTRRVAWEITRAVALPLAIGCLPLVYVALRERVVAVAPLRRWLLSGREADGGFAGYHELKRRAQSIPEDQG